MPGTILRATHVITHPILLIALYNRYYYPFTDDETEAHRY